MSNGITIRFATSKDTWDVQALWELCFPSTDGFNKYYFEKLYHPEYNLLLIQNNRLCAMTQMLPYSLQTGNKNEPVTYIYGACTHPEFRRQHLMDHLLHRTFKIDCENGRSASILIPQEEWLFSFYKQFGYHDRFFITSTSLKFQQTDRDCEIKLMREEDLAQLDQIYHQFISSESYICRPYSFWKDQLNLFQTCGAGAFCAWAEGHIVGYAFAWNVSEELWLQECVCQLEWENAMNNRLLALFNKAVGRMSGPRYSEKKHLGCIRRYDDMEQPEGYMNLMLN